MVSLWWPAVALAALVAGLVWAERRPAGRPWFRWLPVPLWCYLVPALAVTSHVLPPAHPSYGTLTAALLPFALALLLLGVDLPALLRTSGQALLMAVMGAAGIIGGAVGATLLLQAALPAEAWKGAGTLAATWTGGTMNLLSLRTVLETPEPIFAALVIVDALVAYSWMALLVAASAWQPALNRWLRADVSRTAFAAPRRPALAPAAGPAPLMGLLIAAALALAARYCGALLPASTMVSSASGWTVLLVTSGGLLLSLIPVVRRWGAASASWGSWLLLVVLAATGAQARLEAFASAPIWLGFGACVVLAHGLTLLLAGRCWRVPLGVLATASQANIGGLVSAPLVGAVYHQQLAPIGLVLAMAGNAAGTYVGLWVAAWCRSVGG